MALNISVKVLSMLEILAWMPLENIIYFLFSATSLCDPSQNLSLLSCFNSEDKYGITNCQKNNILRYQH